MAKLLLSIVLPCRNEEAAIRSWLRELLNSKSALANAMTLEEIEIIVVDDGSTDNSVELLRGVREQIRLVISPAPIGYGAALKLGFQHARGQWIAFCDLDGTYSIQEFPKLFSVLQKENADMACGNRLHDLRNMPISRRLGNQLFRALITRAFGQDVADSCTGQRIFRAELKENFYGLLPNQLDFALGMTLFGLRQGLRAVEVPVSYHRRLGRSKLSVISDGFRFLNTILRYSRAYRFEKFAVAPLPEEKG